jgi:predicted dehydrogenase
MTTTYAGCERMAAAVRTSGITFAMGYNNRFNTALQRIATLLQEGHIGQVRYARALLTSQMQDPTGWRAQPEQANYWALSAVGTHLIDLWRWYFGDPASLGGVLVAPVHRGPHDEVAALVLNYPDRLLAEVCVSVVFREGNRLELHGDGGAIIGEGLFGSRPGGSFTCNGHTITCQAANPFREEVADFVQAIQQQRQPRVTLEDGLRNVYIMEAARTGALQHQL